MIGIGESIFSFCPIPDDARLTHEPIAEFVQPVAEVKELGVKLACRRQSASFAVATLASTRAAQSTP